MIALTTAINAQVKKEKENQDIIMLSLDYASNSNSFGRSITGYKQPTYTGMFSYFSKSGFDFSIAPSFLNVKDSIQSSHSAQIDIMLGYRWDITTDISLYGGYSHMFFTDNSDEVRTAVSNVIEGDLEYYKNFYSTGIGINYLFGRKGMIYVSYRNALNFNFEKVFLSKDNLFISLETGVDFSDKNYYNEFIYNDFLAVELLQWVNNHYPSLLNWVARRILFTGLDAAKDSLKSVINTYNSTIFGRQYTFTSINILLPVMYSIDNFTVNFGVIAVIPLFTSDFYTPSRQLFYSAGITYMFSM